MRNTFTEKTEDEKGDETDKVGCEKKFEFVFTPKHASWLNLVESFFSKMTRQMLKGIRVKTKEELIRRIYTYFDEINAEPFVFHWTWHLDDIDPTESVKTETLLEMSR